MWIGKKQAYLKPPDSVKRPRASKYGLLCIFFNFLLCFFTIGFKMSLMPTPYVKYHKLTEVSNKKFSHYDNTSENCGPLR